MNTAKRRLVANNRRRSYRVAKKQIEHSPERGTFVSKEQKKSVTMLAAVLLVLLFIEGLILGLIVSHKD